MILLESILHTAVLPAYRLLPCLMDSPAASVMVLAIGLQESHFMYRFQKIAGKPYLKGPAKGFWQFEEGGGVRGVMRHEDSEDLAKWLCHKEHVDWGQREVHQALETNDVLAAAFARLLLWTDLQALPPVDASDEAAWQYYVNLWKPGKPHRETWDEFHQQAVNQIFHHEEASRLVH